MIRHFEKDPIEILIQIFFVLKKKNSLWKFLYLVNVVYVSR